jgi:hypothetical protein
MASLAEYFAGVTGTIKTAQIVDLEMIANKGTITDLDTGEVKEYIASYTRNLYTGEYETRTYVFEGVPVSIADNLPESVTVTEVGGTSHTVHLREFVSDGSSGTAIFENDRNTVTVHRVSPHMRTIEVTRTIGALKCNGLIIKYAPAW